MENKPWKEINTFAFWQTINPNNACKLSPDIILEMLSPVPFQMEVVAHWDILNGCNRLRIDFTLTSKALGCGTKSLWWGIREAGNPIGCCQPVTERSRSLLTLYTSALHNNSSYRSLIGAQFNMIRIQSRQKRLKISGGVLGLIRRNVCDESWQLSASKAWDTQNQLCVMVLNNQTSRSCPNGETSCCRVAETFSLYVCVSQKEKPGDVHVKIKTVKKQSSLIVLIRSLDVADAKIKMAQMLSALLVEEERKRTKLRTNRTKWTKWVKSWLVGICLSVT